MRRTWSRSLLSLWLAAQLAATGCQPPAAVPASKPAYTPPPAPPAAPPAPSGRPELALPADPAAGTGVLTVDLTAAPPIAAQAAPVPMSQAETDALLARLEPLPDVAAKPAPIVRPASAAPPRQGPAVPIAFVAPTGKQVADAPIGPSPATPLPLVAPDIQPSGEIREDSEIRLRFDEPMVPVGAVGGALPDAAHAPATIAPAIPGTWRWIDTRVATFTAAAPRLPMATELTVTVPAGTRALSGATLAADAVQKLATPGPSIRGLFPNGWSTRIRPDSPIVIELDQDVDPAAIAPFLSVIDRRTKQKLAFTRTTLDAARPRWARNPSLPLADLDRLGRHTLVIAPTTAWPAGANLFVQLAAGAPSREGPRKAARASGSELNVAERFAITGLSCDDQPRRFDPTCSAASWLRVEVSNPIDPKTYRSTMIQIAGRPVVDHVPYDNSVTLDTPDVVGRAFTISVASTGITDIYGQPLANPRDLAFTTSRVRYQPYLWAHETGMYILDPRFAQPQWVIDAQAVESLHVELYRVEPADYFAYRAFEDGKRKTPPGKKLFDHTYEVGKRSGSQLRQDLAPALGASGTGHVIAIVRTPEAGKQHELAAHAWIQVSKLGVTARFDREKVSAWVESIAPTSAFLAPVANAQAQLVVEGRKDVPPAVATDARGAAAFALPDPLPAPADSASSREALLVATAGADSVFTAIDTAEKSVRRDFARWYVTDDRFTYKPGEPVYVKGWLRWTHDGVNPDLAMPTAGASIAYTLQDGRGNKLASGTTTLSDQGGFDLVAQIPANANLGNARFSFSTPVPGHPDQQSTYDHRIAIQEFRTPAFAVTLDDDVGHSGALPLVAGQSTEMLASAKYYSGGGLAGAAVKWDAHLEPSTFRPPGWDDFSFDPIRKRSESDRYWSRHRAHEGNGSEVVQTGTLSAESASRVTIGIPAVPWGEPAVLSVDATITDLDRQTIRSSSRAIVVHPSTYYVGLRQKHDDAPASWRQGELLAIATDIDGKPVIGVPIDIELEGVLGSERWRDDAKVIDTQHCRVTSAAEPVACPYTRKDDQTAYKATAHVADPRGRKNGAQYDVPWWSPDRKSELSITADRASYRVGDTAKLVIHSATVPATATVTFARQGVIAQRRVELAAEATPVELPIEPGFVENVHVLVDRVARRKSVRVTTNPEPLPEHTTATAELEVDLASVRLAMTTRPLQPIVEPGANASFEVTVQHDGKPVAGAEVALLAVDEAVLSLSDRKHQDPLPEFYAKVGQGTSEHDTLGLVNDAGEDLAGKPGFERWSLDTLGHGSGTGTGYGYGSGRGGLGGRTASAPSIVIGAAIETRKDFRATAAWSPRLHTDAHGKATLTVKMPDSLTRYRIVALATATGRWFGKAENTIVSQLPINARTVAPRFLTQGDAFALPVVVQNLDSRARTIDVAVRAANLVASGTATGQRITVAAGQRAELRFPLATVARGTAAIQTIARSADRIDATTVEVPVYEPATTESFATYGVVDDKPQFERLAIPGDIFPEVGGVEAEVSSTQLQTLTDAYWYLYAYPYECAEQRSARMLATSAMADVLDAFATPGRPTRAVLEAQRVKDLARLAKDQNSDGGWNFYPGMASDPYITQQVLAAFAAGPGADAAAKTKAVAYVTRDATTRLARLEQHAHLPLVDRKNRDEEPYDVGVVAAELATLAAAGVDAVPRATRLHAAALALDAYPIDAKARLLALVAGRPQQRAMRARLLADLLANIHETAAGATVTAKTLESERLLFGSNAKTTALALAALVGESPRLPVIEKLAHGVLEARAHGRWLTTQDNLVVLQTMRRYFDTYEQATPNYTGKLWFGTAAYAERAFAGHTSERAQIALAWPDLGAGSTHDIALAKTGTGRMYYRIGITYAPKQTHLPALDAGFIVRRSYAAVDDPGDVVRGPDGAWTIKLGARVVVQLEVVNTTRRNVVGLVDPIPAGFEPVNTALANAERGARGATAADWNHVMMRDNRAEAFASSLAEGTHHFSYTARATIPGTYVAAPAKAEEMYAPETFGRSDGTVVTVSSPAR